jgi:hypothetical protein
MWFCRSAQAVLAVAVAVAVVSVRVAELYLSTTFEKEP